MLIKYLVIQWTMTPRSTRIAVSNLQMKKPEFLEFKVSYLLRVTPLVGSRCGIQVYLITRPALYQTLCPQTIFSTSLFKSRWSSTLGHLLLEVFLHHFCERWDSPRNDITHSPPVLYQVQSHVLQKALFYLP